MKNYFSIKISGWNAQKENLFLPEIVKIIVDFLTDFNIIISKSWIDGKLMKYFTDISLGILAEASEADSIKS